MIVRLFLSYFYNIIYLTSLLLIDVQGKILLFKPWFSGYSYLFLKHHIPDIQIKKAQWVLGFMSPSWILQSSRRQTTSLRLHWHKIKHVKSETNFLRVDRWDDWIKKRIHVKNEINNNQVYFIVSLTAITPNIAIKLSGKKNIKGIPSSHPYPFETLLYANYSLDNFIFLF